MDQLAGRHGGLDGVEEAQELLVAVPLHAASEHRPVQDGKYPPAKPGAL